MLDLWKENDSTFSEFYLTSATFRKLCQAFAQEIRGFIGSITSSVTTEPESVQRGFFPASSVFAMVFEKSSTLRLLAILVIAGLCFLCAEAQTPLYVSVSTGVDGPTCGTVGSPCASLQGALNVLGSSAGSIFIAAGMYTGANNTNLNIAVSNVSIVTIGLVTFSGGGSVQGWTLSGNNVVIENIVFSNFQTIGSRRNPLQRGFGNSLTDGRRRRWGN
jgi:hypothetical protein